MFDVLSTWQFNVIAYLVSAVFFVQYNRQAVKNARDNGAATLLLQSIAALAIVPLIPFFDLKISGYFSIWMLLLLASFFYAINDRLQTPIRKNLEVSDFSIIQQLFFIFLFVYGLLLFGEPYSHGRAVGALIIIVANLIVLYDGKRIKTNRYTWLAVGASFVLATAVSIDVGISEEFNLPFYIFLTLSLPGIFISVGERIAPRRLLKEAKESNMRHYIIAGVAWSLVIFFTLRAFQFGEVTQIVPVQSFSVILNVLVAYLFFGERHSAAKKFLGALMAVAGVSVAIL